MSNDPPRTRGPAESGSVAAAEGIEKGPPVKMKSRRSGTYLYAGDLVAPDSVKHLRLAAGTETVGQAALKSGINPWFGREEVRLDIDGDFPQMAISGTGWNSFALLSDWIARLTQTGPQTYQGDVEYGVPALPESFFCRVFVVAGNDPNSGDQTLELAFMNASMEYYTRHYKFQTQFFRKLELEYDYVTGVVPVTAFNTAAHPDRPPTLIHEILDIETVLERAGFDTTLTGGQSEVGIAEAGQDTLWEDKELHDAMQVHWSHHADKPQWALWALFASHHASNYGGVMFDWNNFGNIPNPYQRQGVAIFEDSFIAVAPGNEDPNDAPAWVERMRVWTAVHEIGHALNLAHTFEGDIHANFWMPLDTTADNEFTLTFMNHATNYTYGQKVFFQNFEFRFSDHELFFLRHAPARFVEPGNESFMSNHAFEQNASAAGASDFELRLSAAGGTGRFPYLLPPVIEAALVNRGAEPKMVPAAQLADQAGFVLMVGAEDRPMRQWLPYLNHCGKGGTRLLMPGQALYDSLVVGAGRTGWLMARPGRYGIQAVLRVGDQLVFSNPLTVTVEAPASRAEERLAVDFFTPEVGRVLAVNGSRAGDGANAVLARALELKDNPVSKLAAMALAAPLGLDFKLLEMPPREAGRGAAKRFTIYRADPTAVRALLDPATQGGAEGLIDAMGHARYLREAPLLARALAGKAHGRADRSNAAAAAPLPVAGAYAEMLAVKAAGLAL